MSEFTEKFIVRKMAAEYLGISSSSLDRLLRDEGIPHFRLKGRVFFLEEKLDQ